MDHLNEQDRTDTVEGGRLVPSRLAREETSVADRPAHLGAGRPLSDVGRGPG